MRRTDSVILIAARSLTRSAALGADFLSRGQMLHFVQHDKSDARIDHNPHTR